jgi:integrase/recombinase XerD
VLGDYGAVVAPAERNLAYLSALERSPNTVRAYAVSLRMWFEFLTLARVVWADASPENVARFVAWLRSPGGERDRAGDREVRWSAATVNRHLAALFGFYNYHAPAGWASLRSFLSRNWPPRTSGHCSPASRGRLASG